MATHASRQQTYFFAAIVGLMVTLVGWAFPATVLLAWATSWLESLAAAIALLVFVAFPLYAWGLVLLLRKLKFLGQVEYPRYLWSVALGLLFALCMLFPFLFLHDEYGFAVPVTPSNYTYDACVLHNGAASESGTAPFVCVMGQGEILQQP